MTKLIVAVSGGVDSVVLLDALSKTSNTDLVIAHFDHGIRDDSAKDATFVAELAKKYNLPFETKREELGKGVSEEKARIRRYKFLREIAKKYDAKLVTAQHSDDAIETIAINLSRGTGWRGLAAMDSDIVRPLINMTKEEIISYAKRNNLSWREDSTNTSDYYLRNRLRRKLENLDDDTKRQILALWTEQKRIKKEIDEEVYRLVASGPALRSDSQKIPQAPTPKDHIVEYSRYFFTHIDETSAAECLRQMTGALLTRPQIRKALHAIKTTKPHKIYLAGAGVRLKFTSRNFSVELIK